MKNSFFPWYSFQRQADWWASNPSFPPQASVEQSHTREVKPTTAILDLVTASRAGMNIQHALRRQWDGSSDKAMHIVLEGHPRDLNQDEWEEETEESSKGSV